ncbi:hypothetical protein HaLaN_20094, partial [Haematococcus lacustris]
MAGALILGAATRKTFAPQMPGFIANPGQDYFIVLFGSSYYCHIPSLRVNVSTFSIPLPPSPPLPP